MNTIITTWHISDYSGRRSGIGVIFQNKPLFLCERLREWVRWGQYLIRYKDILWYCGYEKQNYLRPSLDELLFLFEKYIEDKPLFQLAEEVERFSNEKHKRWFYAKLMQISKKQLDLIPDKKIKL